LVNRPEATPAEFLLSDESWDFKQPRVLFSAEDEGEQLVGRQFGKFARLHPRLDGGLGSPFFNRDGKIRLADGDFVAVLEIDDRELMLRPLFRGFVFLAPTPFLSVDVGAVQAAEVAEGCLRRAGFQDEMVPGNLGVVREHGVAVRHATEKERVVFRESEDLPLGWAFGDGKRDGHTDVLRFSEESVCRAEEFSGSEVEATRSRLALADLIC